MGFSFRLGLTADDWRETIQRAARTAALWVDQAHLDRIRRRVTLATDAAPDEVTVWVEVEPYILPLISNALPEQVRFQAIRVIPKETD